MSKPEEFRTYLLGDKEKESLVEQLKVRLAQVDGIRFAFLHGSVTGDLPVHDIDVALFFDDFTSEEYRTDTVLGLSVELTAKIGIPVDIHALNGTSLGFQFEVIRGTPVFSRNDDECSEYIQKVWSMYLDFEPLLKQVVVDLLQP